MTTHARALRNRVAVFLEKVAGLNAAAALGYADSDATRIEDNLRELANEPAWAFIDATKLDETKATAALAGALSKQKVVVIAVTKDEPSLPVELALRAAIAEDNEIAFPESAAFMRPKEQTCLFVILGVEEIADAHESFDAIPYWDFMR